MKRLMMLCVALSLCTPMLLGCQEKAKTERQETVTTPGGTTTTTDTHEVKSSGDHPPASSTGETAK